MNAAQEEPDEVDAAEGETEEVGEAPEASYAEDDDPQEPWPWLTALGVTVAVAATFHFAFAPERAGTALSLVALGSAYAALAPITLLRLRARGDLGSLRPRGGDLTLGALVAVLLYGMGYAFHALFTSPGTLHEAWIIRVYLLLGDPFSDTRHLVAAGVALVGVLEELTWRGLVYPSLASRLGPARAVLLSSLLFSLAHAPSLFSLSDPVVGLNPLLVVAAFGCGLGWAYLRMRVERLAPVLLSHALFTWAVVEFPIWSP